VYEVFHLARGKIANLLGKFDWDEAERCFGFGPGATTRLSRRKADRYYKFGPKPDTTLHNLALSRLIVSRVNPWVHHLSGARFPASPTNDCFNVVQGNKVTTVPKSSKTDRPIAIEPDMNSYVQKGIGACIRRRLKRCGVDLDDQTLNQRLAREGSLDNSLATIDLSSASDTVSRRLVELLLPEDWFHAMNISRSHFGTLPSGEIIRYQKFSSMGNGFTFELESLIFWALAQSVLSYLETKDHRLGIYGDDLIVPSECASLLLNVLKVCGFTPNEKKTFVDGPFRESCGKHYFNGIDVTPFYLRKQLDEPQPMFVAVNNHRRWLARKSEFIGKSDWKLHTQFVRMVPKWLRSYRGPDGYGDDFLAVNFEEARPQKVSDLRRSKGHEGWHYDKYCRLENAPLRKSARVDGESLMTKSLSRLETGRDLQNNHSAAIERFFGDKVASSDDLTIRLRKPIYKSRKGLAIRWPYLGYPLR
jgi:hypothetical protein